MYRHLETIYQAVRSGRAPEGRLAQWMVFFLGEHLIGHRHVQSANDLLVSPILFWASVSNFSLNLYLISSLYFLVLSIGDKTLICCLLGLQFTFVAVAFHPLIQLANDVNGPGKLYGKAQSLLVSPCFLSLKLKLLAAYEQTHSENEFHFTVGALGKVTNNSVFEFILLYSAQLMFIFNMFAKQINPF